MGAPSCRNLGSWGFSAKDSLPYASAVGACAFAAQWLSALELLEEMTERRLPAELAAYNAAIMACQRSSISSMFDQALPLGRGLSFFFSCFFFVFFFAVCGGFFSLSKKVFSCLFKLGCSGTCYGDSNGDVFTEYLDMYEIMKNTKRFLFGMWWI